MDGWLAGCVDSAGEQKPRGDHAPTRSALQPSSFNVRCWELFPCWGKAQGGEATSESSWATPSETETSFALAQHFRPGARALGKLPYGGQRGALSRTFVLLSLIIGQREIACMFISSKRTNRNVVMKWNATRQLKMNPCCIHRRP